MQCRSEDIDKPSRRACSSAFSLGSSSELIMSMKSHGWLAMSATFAGLVESASFSCNLTVAFLVARQEAILFLVHDVYGMAVDGIGQAPASYFGDASPRPLY